MKKKNTASANVPVVILAGGRGTRLMEETGSIPKPMVTVGGLPILLHIMRYYGSYGFKKFIICLGYKGHVIKEYFMDLPKHMSSLVVRVGRGEHRYEPGGVADWDVSLVETGEHSLTGTRLYRARDYIRAPNFCLTYGDGLSDIALDRELQFHLKHGKLGTVAAVHPPSRFGKLEIVGGTRVRAFREKEKLSNDYINGGFMVFRREMLDRLSPAENESLESTTLTRLAADGKLQAYLHDGFWRCMDTLRDREQLDAIYESGKAPWVRW